MTSLTSTRSSGPTWRRTFPSPSARAEARAPRPRTRRDSGTTRTSVTWTGPRTRPGWGIRQAKRTLIVLSRAYLEDNLSDFENVMAQSLGIEEGAYRVLPVRIEPI